MNGLTAGLWKVEIAQKEALRRWYRHILGLIDGEKKHQVQNMTSLIYTVELQYNPDHGVQSPEPQCCWREIYSKHTKFLGSYLN